MRFSTLVLASVLLAAGPAAAQIDSREGIELQNQILELRQQLQQLQQLQSQTGGQQTPPPAPADNEGQPAAAAVPNDMLAQLVVRVSTLEEQMRALQGRVDELTNAQQRDHDDLAKQIGDLAFKLSQGAAPAAPPAAATDTANGAAQSVPGDDAPAKPPPPPPVHRTPEQSLRIGNAALARRDYDAAAAAAQEVLAAGKGARMTDAQFLLAHAEAGKHDFKQAAASYYAVYKASPRSPRGAESLIGVSIALLGLGDKPHACQALEKFGAEFPHPDAGLRGEAASVRKRAGC